LDGGAPLGLKFSDQLADSIREGYTQILSGNLLELLEQPPARALYRLLEAHRTRDEGGRSSALKVSLEDWRRACGVITERPDNARRTLEAAHLELCAVGYLAEVLWTGRGKDIQLEYRFAEEDAPDPALVALLTEQGVAMGTARALVRGHAPHIEEAIAFLKESKTRGYKVRSSAALLVDYLRGREQGKYALPEVSPTPQKRREAKDQLQKRVAEQEQKVEDKLRAELDAVAALPLSEQWDKLPGLRFLLGKKLSPEELKTLEARSRAGHIEVLLLYRDLLSHVGKRSVESYLEGIRLKLREEVLL
jgi:plasmid replication initiation protein